MKKTLVCLIAAASLAVGSTASADQSVADLKQQLSDATSRITDLESRLSRVEGDGWMTEQRAEEIRSLVQDVLADADARASLLQAGMTAGHDGKFFLASPDGDFRLKLSGQLQVRYIYNRRSNDAATDMIDEDVAGFQVRRAKFKGKGHIGNPRIGFAFSLAGDRDDAVTLFEDYYMNYKFENGVKVQAGRWKQPFARENLVSSSRQQAVERSLVLETFNVDRSEGVMVEYEGEMIRVAGAVNDGIDGDFTDFDENAVDVALTGRVDVLLAGAWKQWKDFTAWQGEDTAAFLGAGVHWQTGESNTGFEDDEVLMLTVDGAIETNGFNAFAAFYYSDIERTGVTDSGENMGFEAHVAYNIDDTFEPFFRYELILLDDDIAGLVEDEINVLTFGVNWYQSKHSAKFTLDVVYVVDHIDGEFADLTMLDPSTGLGLLNDDGSEDGQFAVRAQWQLTF
jgi:phosphate-selective porin OprO/OprP